ncbi:hypothetical protein J6590_038098 [Homalodisca vitripennis]|nr:hypothetical protein J6590_038098 [Homalodisca vitripennis]
MVETPILQKIWDNNLIAVQVDMEEAEVNPSTTEMLPVTDQLLSGADSSNVCDVVLVVLGIFIFSETLKQSNCADGLSALSYSDNVSSAKEDSLSIENRSMNS